MIAFSITLCLFLYFAIVGYAILQVFPSRLKPALNLLIAPAVGVCATLLPVFYLNRFGLPVKSFSVLGGFKPEWSIPEEMRSLELFDVTLPSSHRHLPSRAVVNTDRRRLSYRIIRIAAG
jgi:hypothetical protein